MSVRRIATVGLAILVMLGATATSAAAVPDEPAPVSTVNDDVFPGAQLGGARTGPLASSVPAAGGNSTTALAGGPFIGFTCDGTAGPRVEVLYVREASMPDRYAAMQPVLQAWLLNADAAWNDAAARHAESRHIRYLTETVNGSCQAVVRNVVVPAGALDTFDASINAVKALGYNAVSNRKYLLITEATVVCGLAQGTGDDQPGAANAANTAVRYARVDAAPNCLGANAIAHEFGHTIGAIQSSAPHFASTGHCSQGFDLMCYAEDFSFDCAQYDHKRLPDCGGDDFFSAQPAAGTYLATHWNTANSVYFRAGTTADNQNYPRSGWTYTVQNVASGRALDVDPDGGTVRDPLKYLHATAASSTAPSQQWLVTYNTGLQLQNRDSFHCVDTAYSGVTPGTRVLQYDCNGQDGMRWAYLPHSDGSFTILNWRSGLALTQPTAAGALVDQQVYTGAPNQRWFFTRIADPGTPVDNAVYTIAALSNRAALSAPVASDVGQVISHAARSANTTQQFRLQAIGSYWQLVHVRSGLCAANTQNATEGLALTLRTCSTNPLGQQWTLRRVADSRFLLVNRHSGKVAAMTTGLGSPIEQQTAAPDDTAQIWAFARV
ncbi:RICIN domain-containing protein [Catenuloplanes sp. NPDC051500]|uniref:RICIN domain-containing protein n=1 Tax=Catenuloplanes sp. NPDC051500 TaxID=3363959 RepID=UPI0037A99439